MTCALPRRAVAPRERASAQHRAAQRLEIARADGRREHRGLRRARAGRGRAAVDLELTRRRARQRQRAGERDRRDRRNRAQPFVHPLIEREAIGIARIPLRRGRHPHRQQVRRVDRPAGAFTLARRVDVADEPAQQDHRQREFGRQEHRGPAARADAAADRAAGFAAIPSARRSSTRVSDGASPNSITVPRQATVSTARTRPSIVNSIQ